MKPWENKHKDKPTWKEEEKKYVVTLHFIATNIRANIPLNFSIDKIEALIKDQFLQIQSTKISVIDVLPVGEKLLAWKNCGKYNQLL